MLSKIKDKVTGWIAGIIVGVLIVSFAFWGVSFYFGQGGNVNVAIVNGNDISLQNFQRSFYNLRQQMRSILGEELSIEREDLVKKQTLQKLINNEVVNQIVEENNFRVSDEQVLNTIQNLDLFQSEDGFDRLRYEQGVSSLGMEPKYFEHQLRMDLLARQLQAGLSETLFVLDSELNEIVTLKLQTRDITYTILNIDDTVDQVEVTDSEIEEYYQSNSSLYTNPEKVKIAYIELDVQKIAEKIEADEEVLRAYYDENKAMYDVSKQRSVKKLFVKKSDNKKDRVREREIIESAKEQVDEGKTFEEVIESFNEEGKGLLEFSEHPFMNKGVMEKEVDEFLFSTDEESISDIIETEKGFSIVKVDEIKDTQKNVFENVAEQVGHDYKLAQAELKFFELSDQLATVSYEHPDTLEFAAEATGEIIQETDFFSRDNTSEGVTSNADVISASFDPDRIHSGENSAVIELGEQHVIVLRVLDYRESSTKPLIEVRDTVVADVKKHKAAEKLKQAGQAIVEQLESGKSFEEVSSDAGFEWKNAENVGRNDVNINRFVLRSAFELGKSKDNRPRIIGRALGSGDYAIIAVIAVHEAAVPAKNNDEESTTMQETDIEFLRTRGATEWQEFLEHARDSADVVIMEKNM